MEFGFLKRFQSPSSTPPDRLLGGHYKVLSQLGAGGFGQTFLAQDIHLPGHPLCVLKQLQPQFTSESSLQIARRLFDTEAQVLYRLGSHDQIPRLLAHFEDAEEFYLAQEFIEGETLIDILIDGQPWSERQVLALLRDILYVLSFVHEQNVIHRDIKPANLICRKSDRRMVLIDFGAVKQVTTQILNLQTGQTNLTIAIGTPGYMPNEQLAGNPHFSSDIYAVGMIGIQALTGIQPRLLGRDSKTSEILWRDRAGAASPGLLNLLDRMVRYDYRARYATATEAFNALQQLPAELLAAAAIDSEAPALPAPADPTAAYSGYVGTTVPAPPLPAEPLQLSPSLDAASADAASADADPETLPPGTAGPGSVEAPVPLAAPAAAPPPTVRSTQHTLPLIGRSPAPPPSQRQELTLPAFLKAAGQSSQVRMALLGLATLGLLVLVVRACTPNQPASQTASPPASSPAPSTPAAPTSAELLSQAEGQRQAKQYQAALNLYNQAIARDAKSADAHWGKCYSLNMLQKPEEALAACNQSIALNRNNPKALSSKGYALTQQQNYQEAMNAFDQAVKLQPNFAEAWSNRGAALLRLGHPEEAVASFDRAVKLQPDLAEAWNNRGAALWSLRRFDEAVASIDKAIQLQPDYQDALSLRQQMREKLGR